MENFHLRLIDKAKRQIEQSCEVKKNLSEDFLSRLCSLCDRTAMALKEGKRVFFCGNGGSAADAQHLAAEFVGRFRRKRNALPSMALTTNTSLLSAIANDYGYEQVFSRQIEAFGNRGDILIAISTSGNSPNVLLAARVAKERGIHTVGLTGRSGGQLRNEVDVLLNVPSDDTPRIQETHILVGHIFCDLVEALWMGERESQP